MKQTHLFFCFLSLLYICTFNQHSAFCLLMSKGGQKGKGSLCCVLFLLPSLSSLSVCGWLIWGRNRSGKGYVWYGSLVFCFSWNGIASFLCLKQVLVQRENVILRYQYLYLVKDVTHLSILALSLTEILCNMSPLEFCAHGGLQCYPICEHGAGNGGLISSPHGLVLLAHWASLTKRSSKIKLLRISGRWQQSIKPNKALFCEAQIIHSWGRRYQQRWLLLNKQLGVGTMTYTLYKLANLIFTVTL